MTAGWDVDPFLIAIEPDADADEGDSLVDTAELAACLGQPIESFVDLAGGFWNRIEPHELLPDDDDYLFQSTAWYQAGDPSQVVLRVRHGNDETVTITVFASKGAWLGHRPVTYPGAVTGEGSHLDPPETWLPAAVREAEHKRRRTFRWCRYCRTIAAPDQMDDGACHGCQERILGAVH